MRTPSWPSQRNLLQFLQCAVAVQCLCNRRCSFCTNVAGAKTAHTSRTVPVEEHKHWWVGCCHVNVGEKKCSQGCRVAVFHCTTQSKVKRVTSSSSTQTSVNIPWLSLADEATTTESASIWLHSLKFFAARVPCDAQDLLLRGLLSAKLAPFPCGFEFRLHAPHHLFSVCMVAHGCLMASMIKCSFSPVCCACAMIAGRACVS